MSTFRHKLGLLSLLALLVFVVGCPQKKSIADIQGDPSKYLDKEVAIEGTVTDSYGALGIGAYQVDDGTGRLWVMSEGYGVPSKGAKVGVAGRVMPTATIGGRTFTTVLRQTHKRK